MKKTPRPAPYLWALYDQDGRFFDIGYATREAASSAAVGPRFHGGHTVRCYGLLTRAKEPRKRDLA